MVNKKHTPSIKKSAGWIVGILFGLSINWAKASEKVSIITTVDSIRQTETNSPDWRLLLDEIIENSEDEKNMEWWQEHLSELAENPISLNAATKETLESIPFLTEAQVEALSYYIYRFGPLVSLSELLLVEGMEEQTLRWLKPFVNLGKPIDFPVETPSLKKTFRYGKQEIRIRTGGSLQEKAGYSKPEDSTQTGNRYLGSPYQINFRYGFNYKGKMQWGIVLEKDAGEKVWNKKNSGIDYVSFHYLIKDQKRIKTLLLGDYNLQFGQGLVCASSFSLGKSTTGITLEQTGSNLSRHFSSSESGFFRGVGATLILKPFVQNTASTKGKFGVEMTSFGSIRKADANVSNNQFSSISNSELHRTEKESEIQNKLTVYTAGAHFSIRFEKAELGWSLLTYRFSADFNPEWKPYNCFNFRGKLGGNYAINYRLRHHGMLLFGEFAMDENRKAASISGITLKPSSRLDISMLGRYYGSRYHSYYGNAFSEGTSVQNEYGLFASSEWRLIKKWRWNAYYDIFIFPWLKYGVNAPSSGYDCAIQATWIPTSNSQILFRFKSKVKEKNFTNGETTFPKKETYKKNQFRIQLTKNLGTWNLKTVLEGNSFEIPTLKTKTTGFAGSQEINFSPENKMLVLSIRYALFDTENYENRIYSYEKDLPGAFSMPSFNGVGNRFSLLLKYECNKSIQVQLKIGNSSYMDREQVGTALEVVQGNQLTDIRSMIRWKF